MTIRALGAVSLSALLFVLAFPPLHLRGLAWIALVPLLLVVRTRSSIGPAMGAAGLWGMLAAYGTTDWLPPTLALYYGQPWWMGLGLFLAAAFVMGAVDYMAFAAVVSSFGRRGVKPMALVTAAAWVLAELGRDRLLTGNPWGLLGYSQMPLSPSAETPAMWLAQRVVQGADLGGVYACTFVLVAVNAAIAEVMLARWSRTTRAGSNHDQNHPSHAAPRIAASMRAETLFAGVVVAAALLYGQARLNEGTAADATRSVAVVQANLDLGSRWDPSLYGRNLDAYLRLTREVLAATPAALVVWPENAMTFFVDREPAYRRAIASVLAPAGASLLAGAPRHEGEAEPVYYNSAFLLAPDGGVAAVYDKQHLLPFAEYFPLSSVQFLRRSFGRVRQFTAGDRVAPLDSATGRLGILICNEAMFPRLARERVMAGAEVLVNLSNDSWVESSEFAEHQFAVVTMRAVEQRRWLVRSSTSGPSAIVDPRGRVVARTAPFTSGTLRGEVEALTGRSIYARAGDTFAAACALVLALCWWFSRAANRAR